MDATRSFLERALQSGLENDIITPEDVLRHATPDALARHLPAELMASLLQAGLVAGEMNAELVVKTLGSRALCTHLPPALVWACVRDGGTRALGDKSEAEKAAAMKGEGAKSEPPRVPKRPPSAPPTPQPRSAAGRAAGKRHPTAPSAKPTPPKPGNAVSPFDDVDTNVRESAGEEELTEVPVATDYDASTESESADALVAQAATQWGGGKGTPA